VLSRAFADFVESDFDLERVGEYPVRGFADPIELFAYQPTSVSVVASPVTTLRPERWVEPRLSVRISERSFSDHLTFVDLVLIMFFSARTSSKRHGRTVGMATQPPSSMRTWMPSMPP
jgi:hypothetical protein